MDLVYLDAREIVILDEEGRSRSWPSPFLQQAERANDQIARRNAWKAGQGVRQMGGVDLFDLEGEGPSAALTCLDRLGRAEIVYGIETDEVGGLFTGRPGAVDGSERRRIHQAGLRVAGVSGAADGRIICSMGLPQGPAVLALFEEGRPGLRELTEGDTIDLAPRFSEARPNEVVFQSAGIGHDAAGIPVGRTPFRACVLDLDSGSLSILWEEPGHDVLCPRVTGDGSVYVIRRPYVDPGAPMPLHRSVLDFFAMPFRLLAAIFGWLNLFAARHSGKPLSAAGFPQLQGPDPKEVWVQGQLVDAEKAARESLRAGDEVPARVPQTWELQRRRGREEPVTLARAVATYDVAPDGTVYYSTGRVIHRLEDGGRSTRVAAAELVRDLVVV